MNVSTRIAARFARLTVAVMSTALFLTGCPNDGPACSGDEQVSVKMTGTCAPGERHLVINKRGCGIYISADPPPGSDGGSDAGVPMSLGLPTTGATDRGDNPIRQGGWSVWGCLVGREPCPDQFRICSAQRIAFQLNVTCVDGAGAPACEAVLTE